MHKITDAALRAHTTRLLLGTSLDPDTATRVAAEPPHPAADPVTAALRDGWRSADLQGLR